MLNEWAIRNVYHLTRNPWGGATIDRRTMQFVPDGIDAYAVSLSKAETLEIPADSDYGYFRTVFEKSAEIFESDYLGVFRNEKTGMIEFDPVIVVAHKEIAAAILRDRPDNGGAYHFLTGNGYFG